MIAIFCNLMYSATMLTDTQLDVVRAYYGVDGPPLTVVALGLKRGTSHQAVCQLIARARYELSDMDVAQLEARRQLWKNLPRASWWDKFWGRVWFSPTCWEYLGSKTPRGYGHLTVKRGRGYAHRAVYEYVYGPIADGLDVCHTCDNPPCVRPDHLFVGTAQENMQDRTAKGRGSRWLRGPDNFAEGRSHGRASTYSNYGCRCSPCRTAWRAHCKPYSAAYAARRRYADLATNCNPIDGPASAV